MVGGLGGGSEGEHEGAIHRKCKNPDLFLIQYSVTPDSIPNRKPPFSPREGKKKNPKNNKKGLEMLLFSCYISRVSQLP